MCYTCPRAIHPRTSLGEDIAPRLVVVRKFVSRLHIEHRVALVPGSPAAIQTRLASTAISTQRELIEDDRSQTYPGLCSFVEH
jgi:hypothetical protein